MFFCFDRIDKCPKSLADFERIELEYENSPEEDYNQVNLSVIKESLTCDRLFGYWGFTIEELEDIVMRTPPFATEGYIWSSTSDNMDEMAWTVDLSDAGMSIASMKSNPENLRCIDD